MLNLAFGIVVGAILYLGKRKGMNYGTNVNGTKRTVARGRVQLAAMRNLPVADLLKNQNVIAFLALIRQGEVGTTGDSGYRVVNGGCTFEGDAYPYKSASLSAARKFCPCPKTKPNCDRTTASGAYQFTFATWNMVSAEGKLKSFDKANQDAGAVVYLAGLGALGYVMTGLTISAIKASATLAGWSSMPGGKEPRWTMEQALQFYKKSGGKVA